MSSDLPDDETLSAEDVAQVRSLDAVRASLIADARSYAAQIAELSALAARAERGGSQVRRTLPLELAGSWQISQLTAENWLLQAQRYVEALPLTLAMLSEGRLLRHQATTVLHRTMLCTPEVAAAVEAEVLPAGAELCPSDLGRKLDRVRLRIEAEQADAEEAARQEAERIASRRTFLRPTQDQMALAGAILTPEQGVVWAAGMDALERRERLADRAAGIDRTAEQRRADLFAALPALVLAGTAADDRWRRGAGAARGREQGPRTSAPSQPGQAAPLVETDPTSAAPPWTFSPEQLALARLVLNVHVPMATSLDLSHAPGTLDRYGPVTAEHVRLLRPTDFRRIIVDAHTGRPIAVDDTTPAAGTVEAQRQQLLGMLTPTVVADAEETQHDPSTRLARLIDLRDPRCTGPGCSSSRCDRDHGDAWPHGPTCASNLNRLSARCHSAKHHGWVLVRHPDGSTTWTSPLHRQYDRPTPWDPPPYLDPDTELPPLRARPDPSRSDDDGEERPLLGHLRVPEPEPPRKPTRTWDDEPPF